MGKNGGFRPGSGRKRKVDEDRIRDLCLSAVKKVFKTKDENILFQKLAELANTAKTQRDRIAAINKLLEYTYGKPRESVDLNTEDIIRVELSEDVRNLTSTPASKAAGNTRK